MGGQVLGWEAEGVHRSKASRQAEAPLLTMCSLGPALPASGARWWEEGRPPCPGEPVRESPLLRPHGGGGRGSAHQQPLFAVRQDPLAPEHGSGLCGSPASHFWPSDPLLWARIGLCCTETGSRQRRRGGREVRAKHGAQPGAAPPTPPGFGARPRPPLSGHPVPCLSSSM